MTDFNKVKIGNYINILPGFAFDSSYFSDTNQGIPLIHIRDLENETTDAWFTGNYDKKYIICKDDTLVGMDGDFLVAKWKGNNALLNQRVCKLETLDQRVLNQEFLYYSLIDEVKKLNRVTSATTVKHLSTKNIRNLEIWLPKQVEEQAKIAEVLSTIDRAIAQTEALIAKHQRIKTGLMQDLLTRGIDEHGQLRDLSTHRFKSTPLGIIPEEWEVKTVDEFCYDVCVGIVIKPTQYYVEDGVPALRSANVHINHINSDNLVYINEKSNKLLSKSMLREGYVVSVRTGYPGTSAVVSKEFDGANCIDIIISKPKPELLPKYLSTWVNSAFGKDQVLKAQGGLAQQHFNVGEMKNLVICKPNEDEQERILNILDNQDLLISNEEERLKKLLRTKAGLMQDLLSGRVSVTPLMKGG